MVETRVELTSAETEIETARAAIIQAIEGLRSPNIKGVVGFGSFWLRRPNHNPNDIDLAIYCENEAVFFDQESKISEPLKRLFKLPLQIHPLTPFTPMVRRQLFDYKVFLKDGIVLWGEVPRWLLDGKKE